MEEFCGGGLWRRFVEEFCGGGLLFFIIFIEKDVYGETDKLTCTGIALLLANNL